jgi:hypothetical protein
VRGHPLLFALGNLPRDRIHASHAQRRRGCAAQLDHICGRTTYGVTHHPVQEINVPRLEDAMLQVVDQSAEKLHSQPLPALRGCMIRPTHTRAAGEL